MCRPPDVLNQLSAAERRRQLAAQLFNGGDESYNGGSHGSAAGFDSMAGREWEDLQQSDEIPVSQAERVWHWQQQLAASGLSSGLQTGQKEMLLKQFGAPVMNRGPAVSNMGKATDQGRKAVRQIRSRVLDGHNNQSKGIPTVDTASWKAPTQRNVPHQAPVLSPWGSMPPAMTVTQITPQNVMPGAVSLGGNAAAAAAMYGQMRVANRVSNNASWTPQADGTENLDQWLQETVQFPAPKGRKMQISPSMAPQMQQPWGMSAMDSFEMNGQENQFDNQFGIVESLDMDDDDQMDNDDGTNDKKIRRMLSNRASAKRSRQRRQERLGELEIQTAKLRVENTTITRKYHEAVDQARRYQEENQKLRMDLENLRSELETMKMRSRHSGTSPVKQESGKTSAHSAATAIRVPPTKEEMHNEAHSYPTTDNHFPEEKCDGQESGGQISNNDDCSTKILNPADFAALVSPGQFINRNDFKKGFSNNEESEMRPPMETVKDIVKTEQWVDTISHAMEQGSHKINSPPASGVTSSGMSMPDSTNPGSPSNDICDLDSLGLPVLDTGLLGPDSLGDEWFESLVQCMDE